MTDAGDVHLADLNEERRRHVLVISNRPDAPGIAWAKDGGFVDFTTSTVPAFIEEGEVPCSAAMRRMLEAGALINLGERLADEHGLMFTRFRALNNKAVILNDVDPLGAFRGDFESVDHDVIFASFQTRNQPVPLILYKPGFASHT